VLQRLGFSWLKILISINVIIFAFVFLLSDSLFYTSDFALIGAFSTDYVSNGYWWLLFTSNFVHIQIYHIALNMFSFYYLGRIVDEFYSRKVLLITFIFSGLLGSIFTYFASVFSGELMISVGASGGIFGVAGLLVGGTLKKIRFGNQLPISTSDILVPILVSLSIGIVPGLGVNNWAHLGGLFGGIILGLLLKNDIGEYKNSLYENAEKMLYIASLVFLILPFFLLLLNLGRIILV
jgi:rhomboid protease GluP